MTEIERQLGRLRSASSVEERLAVLERLVSISHGPIASGAGLPAAELDAYKMPQPLRWWYQRFGVAKQLMSAQNRLLSRDELWLDEPDPVYSEPDDAPNQRLVFYVENQSVYIWSTEPSGDDPPVWIREFERGAPWEREDGTLSTFLVQMFLFEAIMQAPFGGSAASLDTRKFDAVIAKMTTVPIGPWRWPVNPHRFYVARDALILAGPNTVQPGKQKWELFAGAKTEEAFEFLTDLLNGEWEATFDRTA